MVQYNCPTKPLCMDGVPLLATQLALNSYEQDISTFLSKTSHPGDFLRYLSTQGGVYDIFDTTSNEINGIIHALLHYRKDKMTSV